MYPKISTTYINIKIEGESIVKHTSSSYHEGNEIPCPGSEQLEHVVESRADEK
jgi:hypothetical protein